MRALSALVFSTVVFAAVSLRAQTASTSETPSNAGPTDTSGTAPGAPSAPATTAASNDTTAAAHRSIVPGLGGFSFEPTAAEKKRAADQAKAEQEAEEEKPRNAIVRLPTYEIQGDRPAVFTKSQLDTNKGLGADAVKKYLSSTQQALNFVHLPSWLGGMSNEQLGIEMYHEQLRLDTRNDLLHQASQLQAAGDLDSANELREQSQDMYLRPHDPAQSGLMRSSTDSVIPSSNLNR